jgi:lipoprotein-anchoring transpeptidase ErfK/SrfK
MLRLFVTLLALAALALPVAAAPTLPPNVTMTPQHKLRVHLDRKFMRQVVPFATREAAGTVIVDTKAHFLYFVLGGGKALRYGIGVARDGFEWSGTHRITRKAEWPGWTPPAQMRRRQPGLPAHMPGGIRNPLGARALYIGATLYRIHGTNEPWTIGGDVSSGCIRLINDDVVDLYGRVKIGAKVIVL